MRIIRRWLRRVFGRPDHRAQDDAARLVARVCALEPTLRAASDEELRARASTLRSRARAGEALGDLAAETFALTREAAARALGMRPYPVQIQCGALLHLGCVTQMRTGEGKTLAAALPAALHALSGRGVHVVTVNDYLAARDAELMGPLYHALGLSVASVTQALEPLSPERAAAYAADITYVSNDELAFDYLRDNLTVHPEDRVLRPLHSALVDEADLVLLDEARTPLIISEPMGDDVAWVRAARAAVAPLREGVHFTLDRRARVASTLEAGWRAMERAVGVDDLSDPSEVRWVHALRNALHACALYERDVDYVVDEDQIVLVDEFTGRVTPDRRLADGLHQALEAKERVPIQAEDSTVARTTYQSFFRLYPRLAGMTGTAVSARAEFARTYGLSTAAVPTHRPMIRRDLAPIVYRTGREKHRAVADEIERLQAAGRPVLVGTTSVRESETLSSVLEGRGVPHAVLNARNDAEEAAIIAQAGRSGAVTLSTSMAGRGVDILLGGNPRGLQAERGGELADWQARCAADHARVVAAGGLAVLGTGLHESKRIDDQLRGRAGRQGDPGSSRYFLSLDDPVYRIYGDLIEGFSALSDLRQRLRAHPADAPITDQEVLRTLRELRRKVEVENETLRKEVMQYDLVVAQQRELIYARRRRLVDALAPTAAEVLSDALARLGDDLVDRHLDPDLREDPEGRAWLADELSARFGLSLDPEASSPPQIARWISERVAARVSAVESRLGPEALGALARDVALETIDVGWTAHLTALERLEDDVGLRGYAGLEPLIEFRKEATSLFTEMWAEVGREILATLCHAEVVLEEEGDAPQHASVHRRRHRHTRRR